MGEDSSDDWLDDGFGRQLLRNETLRNKDG